MGRYGLNLSGLGRDKLEIAVNTRINLGYNTVRGIDWLRTS